jgi:hypothetical protein
VSWEEDYTPEMNSKVATHVASFKEIYIPFPRHTEFHGRCDYLVKLGESTRGKPQMGMRVLALSGSGKTAAAMALLRMMERKYPRTPSFVPIVYIALEKAATSKKLMVAILEYFGDGYSTIGNEMTLKRRVNACLERFGTMLLIIDEAQHLNYYQGERNDVTDSLKRFLDGGVVPILFLGTEEAENLFRRNLQLAGRLLAPCDFTPLDHRIPGDRALFAGFVSALDQAIVDRSLMPAAAELHDPWILACLHEISKGAIGRVSRLMVVALEIAMRRCAQKIEVYDLSLATDRWAVPQSFIKENPFLKGRK